MDLCTEHEKPAKALKIYSIGFKPINIFMKYFRLCPISSEVYVDSGAQVYYRHISGQTMESPNGKLSEEKKNRLSKLEDGIKEQVTLDVIHISTCSTLRYSQPTRSLFNIKELIALEIIAMFHLKEHFQLKSLHLYAPSHVDSNMTKYRHKQLSIIICQNNN